MSSDQEMERLEKLAFSYGDAAAFDLLNKIRTRKGLKPIQFFQVVGLQRLFLDGRSYPRGSFFHTEGETPALLHAIKSGLLLPIPFPALAPGLKRIKADG